MGTEKRVEDIVKTYDHIFNSEDGKVILYDLVNHSEILSGSFHQDPYVNAFRSGKRDVIIYILSKLTYDIDSLKKLIEDGKTYDDKFKNPLDY